MRDDRRATRYALAAERQALATLRRARIEKARAQLRQQLAATRQGRRQRASGGRNRRSAPSGDASDAGGLQPVPTVSVPDTKPAGTTAGVWELCPEVVVDDTGEVTIDGFRGQVIRAVGRHPAGVSATEIGNEIGVDWRRVLRALAELADEGAVERVGREFYPVGKASRKW